jgi:CRISPR-associated protein Csb2
MLALGIRYLTGYAVATDVSDRERAEWPPHPARVFMALAAAHFETGKDAVERASLEWLEEQVPPSMKAGEADRREVVTHYVPVNDPKLPDKIKDDAKTETIKAGVSVLPQHRSRQPRAFPRVWLREDTVYLIWGEVTPDTECRAALDRLCGNVIRIGHSSSLVQMWVETNPPQPNVLPDEAGSLRLRVVSDGTLDYLEAQFNADAIEAYADLNDRIAVAKGKSKGVLKKELEKRFVAGEPTNRRPIISLWQPYRQVDGSGDEALPASGLFDRNVMILALQDGPVVGVETTWQLLTALRDAILSRCDPTPEWISGHQPDGSPSQKAHIALLPMAFVGHPHADGHLLGVALAFPKAVPPRQRGTALRKLLYDDAGRSKPVDLKLGALGTWSLVRETRESPPLALQSQAWIGPSRSWATVTPIVLDRHPKADYAKERQRWFQEVVQIIGESCRRQGLPEPVAIDVGKTCWHRGVPRAIPGKGGFSLMPIRPGQPARQQVHAWLQFDQDVEGPLLLGTGRYRGYGLCKPLNGGGR